MSKFSELIKNFDKIRDYMRDFYIYGFKGRGDFTQKSSRTYDNERRRIESYLEDYIKWDNSKKGKRVFISLDSSKITSNPLYSAWKSKSFTNNDIMLHFYILNILNKKSTLNVEELTDKISSVSGQLFEPQTVRIKANEYVKEGILNKEKRGKSLYYSLSKDSLNNFTNNYENILDAIKFFQGVAPLGVIGSYILDKEEKNNDVFNFKHHFIVHTLEDKVLLTILKAIKEKRKISFINQSSKTSNIVNYTAIPIKIFVSNQSGRRYLNTYNEEKSRFINNRLDYIKSVKLLDEYSNYDDIKEKLNNNQNKCWGVSFGDYIRNQKIEIKFYIDEDKEDFIINRINREGRGGDLEKIDKNLYLYTNAVFDVNEMMTWVKSFTGRIISLETTNKYAQEKFYDDMNRMKEMYQGGESD
ncbi:WYL domain-containing protein [Clostridium sediminicola]|uniref:WYL domain-containing protein n=1 Tax=Clostridium sediminicola TaxID=3114879 RepID=UPI0031F20A64